MGKYQVTQELYQAVMESNPSSFTTGVATGETQGRRPVEKVSWYDAIVFCNRLSALEDLTPVYTISNSTDPSDWGDVPTTKDDIWDAVTADWDVNGYRLPTEAEWEYACRAENTAAYNLGGTWNGDWGWYSGNSADKTHEVGKKTPNAWGLYDMHGNVWDWCWDWYENFTSAPAVDPKGPDTRPSAPPVARIARGGSWQNSAQDVRSAVRDPESPYGKYSHVGFRLARTGTP